MTDLLLIGPRGAGKSSVGARAAGLLARPFVDVDRLVEQRAGLPIAEIFARRGEPAFRDLERAVLLELLDAPGQRVIATGGGCVLDPQVRHRLQRHPGVVWLDAPVNELQRRIAHDSTRPSLTGEDPVRELPHVAQERRPLYRTCAARGLRLDTGALTLEQAVDAAARHARTLDPTSQGGG